MAIAEAVPLVTLAALGRPVRFVITGFQRSGSNLLVGGLAQNPAIHVDQELFCGEMASRPPVAGQPYVDGEPGDAFLSRFFAQPRDPQVRAVGFKWFGDQARDDAAGLAAWRYFRDSPAIRVIALERDDWLAMVVSQSIAEQSQVWHLPEGEPAASELARRVEELPPLVLSPGACARRLNAIARARQMVREDALGHPLLEIHYDELVADYQGTVDRVCEFLAVPPCPVRPLLRKMNREPPSRRLANYAELRAHFAATPYRRFFA